MIPLASEGDLYVAFPEDCDAASTEGRDQHSHFHDHVLPGAGFGVLWAVTLLVSHVVGGQ